MNDVHVWWACSRKGVLIFRIVQKLPAPLSGILSARRPTGAILATIVVVIALFGSLAASGFAYVGLTGSFIMPFWMTLIGFGGAIVLVLLWVRFKEGRAFRSLGLALDRRAPGALLRGAAAGLALITISILALVAVGQATIHWNGGQLTSAGWAMNFVWLGVYAVQSSAEEIAVRGYALQAYARRFGVVAAMIMQAVLFAVLHGGNDGMTIVSLINLLLVGVLLGCLTLVDGNLWGACGLHCCWNWAMSCVFGTAVSGQGGNGGGFFELTMVANAHPLISGGEFGVEGSLIVTVILAAAGGALIWRLARRRREQESTVLMHSRHNVGGSR